MIGEYAVTLFLIGLCVEVAREAFLGKDWNVRHYIRFSSPGGEFPWWAERKSWSERRAHRMKWHIDLLGRSSRKPKKQ